MAGRDIWRQHQGERKLWQSARGKDKEKELRVGRWRWGAARESEFGAGSALCYYFHLPLPELSELLGSELMWAEICLSLWPSSGTG